MPTLLTDTDVFFSMRSFRQAPVPVVLLLAVSLLPMAGCNHSHSADVIATVNGHAIMRAELDKSYMAQLGDAQSSRGYRTKAQEPARRHS